MTFANLIFIGGFFDGFLDLRTKSYDILIVSSSITSKFLPKLEVVHAQNQNLDVFDSN